MNKNRKHLIIQYELSKDGKLAIEFTSKAWEFFNIKPEDVEEIRGKLNEVISLSITKGKFDKSAERFGKGALCGCLMTFASIIIILVLNTPAATAVFYSSLPLALGVGCLFGADYFNTKSRKINTKIKLKQGPLLKDLELKSKEKELRSQQDEITREPVSQSIKPVKHYNITNTPKGRILKNDKNGH